jgi:hypothetical protein
MQFFAIVEQVGDHVRVKRSVVVPKYQWGNVDRNSVGVVTRISADGGDVFVNFPIQGNMTF